MIRHAILIVEGVFIRHHFLWPTRSMSVVEGTDLIATRVHYTSLRGGDRQP